jgi:hypothetical protein
MDFKHSFVFLGFRRSPRPKQDGEKLYDSTWRSCHEHWSSPWVGAAAPCRRLPENTSR